MEIEINGLPRMTNNQWTNWRVRAADVRKWKELVYFHAMRHRPDEPLTKARLTLTRFSLMRPDYDGLVSGFKCIIDGLILSKIIIDDNHDVIGIPEYKWEKIGHRKGKIAIKVESI